MNRLKKHSEKKDTARHKKIRRAAAFLVPLCFFALFLSSVVISLVNDIYAFVRPPAELTLDISGLDTRELAELLEEGGIILNPHIFIIYARHGSSDNTISSFSGKVSFDSGMSYREILGALK